MAPHVTIPDEDGYVVYTATAGQTAFTFDFVAWEKADLTVYQNGTALSSGAWSVSFNSGTDGGYDGGTVTLNSGATSGDEIKIVRDVAAVRSSDQNAGTFSFTALNTELDKETVRSRDLRRDADRAVKAPIGEAGPSIPKAADRASKVYAFDDSGDPDLISRTDIESLAQRLNEIDVLNANIDEITGVYNDLTGDDTIGDAAALLDVTAPGIVAKNGSGTPVSRSITVGDALSIADADGGSGNPSISLHAFLVSLKNLSTTGFIVRKGDGSPAIRSLDAGDGLKWSNPTGDSANPTIQFDTASDAAIDAVGAGAMGKDIFKSGVIGDFFTAVGLTGGSAGQVPTKQSAGHWEWETPAGAGDLLSTVDETVTATWAFEGALTLAALKARDPSGLSDGARIDISHRTTPGAGDGGTWERLTSDQSSAMVSATLAIATGDIDDTNDQVTETGHGRSNGDAVVVDGGDGFTALTTKYFLRAIDANTLSFHTSASDAAADQNRVDITGTTAFNIHVLADPDEEEYAVHDGDALDGSQGAWRLMSGGRAAPETLENKTIAGFKVADAADPTKVLTFDFSGFPADTERTVTAPDPGGPDTMVFADLQQTLKNKLLSGVKFIDPDDPLRRIVPDLSGLTSGVDRTRTEPDGDGTYSLNELDQAITGKRVFSGLKSLADLKARSIAGLAQGTRALTSYGDNVDDGGGGVWVLLTGDQSAKIQGTMQSVTAGDAGADTVTATGHGWKSGDVVRSGSTAVAGVSADTDYYVTKIDDDTLTLHASFADYRAGVAVDITSATTTGLALARRFDPLEILHVAPDSDPTGASGCWRRAADTNVVNVLWARVRANSDASTGNGDDNTEKMQACVDLVKTSGSGPSGVVFIPGALDYYRTTDEINTDGATRPVHFKGDGRESSVIYADFEGAAKGVIRLSRDHQPVNTTEDFGIRTNNTKNCPIGIINEGGTNWYLKGVAVRGGKNSSFIAIGVNNSYFKDFFARNGYQPLNADMPATPPTVSISSGSTTLNADSGTPFSGLSVGDDIFVKGAGANGRNKILQSKVATATSDTSVELEDQASNTVSGEQWCVSWLRGQYDASTNVLTINNGVLDSDDVGRIVSITGVYDYGLGINAMGGRSARIKSVMSPTTCTLYRLDGVTDFNASAEVKTTNADVMIFFAPAVAFYFTEEDNTSNDDINLLDFRIEDHQGPGLYAEHPTTFRMSNYKIHGKGWASTNSDNLYGRTPCCVYLTNIRGSGVNMDQGQFEQSGGRRNDEAQIIVEATERPVLVDLWGTSSLASDGRILSARGIAEQAYFSFGDGASSDDPPDDPMQRFYLSITDETADPRAQFDRALSRLNFKGVFTVEEGAETLQLFGGPTHAAGFTSSQNLGKQFDKDQVKTFYPPASRGQLMIHSHRGDVFGVLEYRTAGNENGAELSWVAPYGDEMAIHGTDGVATLSGSTGPDGTLNISAHATLPMIQIENRIANNHDVTFTNFQ